MIRSLCGARLAMAPPLMLLAAGLSAAPAPAVAAEAATMPRALLDLPGINELVKYRPPVASRVYAEDGRLIGEFGINRVFVPISRIPKRVIHAFVAAEDQRFYEHGGIDPVAMFRAVVSNIRAGQHGRIVGGSTITQQVAKIFLLNSDRTIDRKVKEIVLALRIEEALPKDKILELYLNQIYLGNRSYGVAAAAQTYFGKSLDELTIAEAAMLAALPKAPSATNPLRNPLLALERRDYVLDRMREDGYITPRQADAAKQEPLMLHLPKPRVHPNAEYFVEEVRRDLVARYGKAMLERGGFTVRTSLDPTLQRYAQIALRRGLVAFDRRHGYRGPIANLTKLNGRRWKKNWQAALDKVKPPVGRGKWPMAVVLSVDAKKVQIGLEDGGRGEIPLSELIWARKQGRVRYRSGIYALMGIGPWIRRPSQVLSVGDVILVEKVAETPRGKPYPAGTYALRQVPIVSGALVALDPHTGRVRAMVGGYSFKLSQYNTATQAHRQPGSAFKPFVYLTALENGFTPSTLIRDEPTTLRTDNGETYSPHNYGGKFFGPTTMRRGLELSRNVMAVRLSLRVGLEKVAALAERLGVFRGVRPVMSMALGAYETTPLKMAAAYGIIANGGKRVMPTLIDRIQDRTGHTVFRSAHRRCDRCIEPVWNHQTMPQLRDEREQLVSPQSAFQLTQILEGVIKRGTGIVVSSLNRPLAGKTGTTNDWVDAWFVGYSPDLVAAVWVGYDHRYSLSRIEQGGRTAAPIFKTFMQLALAGKPVHDFPRPPGLVAMRVGLYSGLPAKYGPTITEYFKPGHEPTATAAYTPDRNGYFAFEVDPNKNSDTESDVVRGYRDRNDDRVRSWVKRYESDVNMYGR
jgi:penicillin-binding protein 1A